MPAGSFAVLAGENAGVHVGHAVGSYDSHFLSVHVDQTRHINSRPRVGKGEFEPGVGDLAVDHSGVGVDSAAGTTSTLGEGQDGRAVGRHRGGDKRCNSVDPRACWPPTAEDDILIRLVGELVGVVTIGANPDVGGFAERVEARKGTERAEDAQVTVNEATLSDLAAGLLASQSHLVLLFHTCCGALHACGRGDGYGSRSWQKPGQQRGCPAPKSLLRRACLLWYRSS